MKKLLIILGLTFFLALFIDALIGSYLLKFTSKKINPSINHNIYDHDLKKNFKESLEWVPGKNYMFCTDQNFYIHLSHLLLLV